MSDEILLGIFINIASSILYDSGKLILNSLRNTSSLSSAIAATAKSFTSIEGVEQTLSEWCAGEYFSDFLDRLKQGERNFTDDEIVTLFIDTTGFYVGEDTRPQAYNILKAFAGALDRQIYASKDGLSYFVSRHETQQTETLRAISDLPRKIVETLGLQSLPADSAREVTAVKEQIYNARIDEARNLLLEGRVSSARGILERLQVEISGSSPSAELQFRIITNLGACALDLDDLDTARVNFEKAFALQPNDPKALSNLALAALLGNEFEQARVLSAQARQADPQNPNATITYIQSLRQLGKNAEIGQLMLNEPWIYHDPDCALVLGQIKFDDHNFIGAEAFLRLYLQSGQQKPIAGILLAEAIYLPIQESMQSVMPWRLPSWMVVRLEEADRILLSTIEALKKYENRKLLHGALVTRAGIRGALGRLEEALRDVDAVLLEDEQNTGALHNKGLIFLQTNQPGEAIRWLEKIQGQNERNDAAVLLADAYLLNDQPSKTVEMLQPLWKLEDEEQRHMLIIDLLLAAYAKLGSVVEIEKMLQFVSEKRSNDPDVIALIAHQRVRDGKVEEAIALLKKAKASASQSQTNWLSLDLANLYYSEHRYVEAAEEFRPIVDTNVNNPTLQKYIISLFNAGSLNEAYSIAQTVRGAGEAIPVITEIEVRVLEYIGNLTQAKELRLQLSQKEPKNVAHRVQLALIEFWMGDRESARELLNIIRYEDIKDDATTLIQIAQTRSLLGMDNILPLTYRARQLEPENPDMHLAYMSLFLRREELDQIMLIAGVIDVDCAVHLTSGNVSRVFIIVDRISNLDPREIPSTSDLAKKLIGCQKGDEVILRESPLEELSYGIVDVHSKYVFAFQETMSEFTTRFPNHSAIQMIRVEDHSPAKMLAMLDERHKMIALVTGAYQERQLTLGAFAKLVGRSLFEVWAGLMSQIDGRLIASSGNIAEAEIEIRFLSQADKAVLDFTALLTLAHVQLIDRLPNRFSRILIAQSTLDQINQILATDFFGPRPSMVVWKEKDQYLRQDVTAESFENGRRFLQQILGFLESKAEIAPANLALNLSRAELNGFEDTLGRYSIDTILIAKELDAPLYADDLMLRMLARNDWQVEGFWTQTLLADMQHRGVISDDEYHGAIRVLALSNYYFLSVNADDLIWILRKHDFVVTGVVAHVLRILSGPDCSPESSLTVLSELIYRLWLEPISEVQKVLILDQVLATLIAGRHDLIWPLIRKLKSILQKRFARVVPWYSQEVMRNIDLWTQQRLVAIRRTPRGR